MMPTDPTQADRDAAAQIWCLPEHSSKEMDAAFAESIALTIAQARSEGFRAGMAEGREDMLNRFSVETRACYGGPGASTIGDALWRTLRSIRSALKGGRG